MKRRRVAAAAAPDVKTLRSTTPLRDAAAAAVVGAAPLQVAGTLSIAGNEIQRRQLTGGVDYTQMMCSAYG